MSQSAREELPQIQTRGGGFCERRPQVCTIYSDMDSEIEAIGRSKPRVIWTIQLLMLLCLPRGLRDKANAGHVLGSPVPHKQGPILPKRG
jgi:hypothetical protein